MRGQSAGGPPLTSMPLRRTISSITRTPESDVKGCCMLRNGLIAAALLCALSAAAEVPSSGFYVGAYGGTQFQLTSWHLHEDASVDDTPLYAGVLGVRFGGMVHSLVAIEAGVGILPFVSNKDELNIALDYSAVLQLLFFEGVWVPYFSVGAGLYHHVSGDHGSDIDYHVHYGLGVRGMLTDWLALRIDVRHRVSDGFQDELAHKDRKSVV